MSALHLSEGQAVVIEHKTTSLDIGPASSYWRRLTLDPQTSNYYRGARAIGIDPVGVVFDVVRKVSIRPLTATPAEDRKYTVAKYKACPVCKKKGGEVTAPHAFIRGADDEFQVCDPRAHPDAVFCEAGKLCTDPGGKLYSGMREHDETMEEYRARVRADIHENVDKYFARQVVVRLAEEEREAAFDAWDAGQQIRESQRAGRWPRNPDACDSYGSLCPYFDVCTGQAALEDPARFRLSDSPHEELSRGAVTVDVPADGITIAERRALPVLSTSSMRMYRSCPRKYFYYYEQRRRPVDATGALRFGTLFHLGLEHWWKTGDLAGSVAAMRAAYAAQETDTVDHVRAEELLAAYHARWAHEPFEVLGVEVEFRLPLVNPASGAPSKLWQLGGKVDALARVVAPAAAE